MSDDIPATLKDAVANENEASPDGETLILGVEIGGVYQEITVTKEWYEDKMQP
jgi:hypothetical protein